ncbi:MAG TPA: UDP-glucose 4-epimerase GalE [Saprospiraceae bacterium]|nr:UDP-glucose 4-epimerase GalE [Saprospiraceae bacterium]
MQKVLVTGGCGYIGSHTIIDLIDHGYHVISIDDFSNSDRSVLARIAKITGIYVQNYPIDLCDQKATAEVFKAHRDLAGIIHFAAFKAVGESVAEPVRYFRNNLNSLLNVAEETRRHAIPCFVYSSSCTVYGNPDKLPVNEHTPLKKATSPYGRTKQMGEEILHDVFLNQQTQVISLRYFNPAGAHPSGDIGEAPSNPAQNLVPIITETAAGLRKEVVVYGADYPTRDGTCIRDYIHVMDLARAHTLAFETSDKNEMTKPVEYVNLGIGEGVTVLEAIQAFQKVSGEKLNYRIGARRPGDVIAIYADYSKARELLGWEPKYGVEEIMKTAWVWEMRRNAI